MGQIAGEMKRAARLDSSSSILVVVKKERRGESRAGVETHTLLYRVNDPNSPKDMEG